MKTRISLIIGLILIFSTSAFAQNADDVIAKHLKATGLDKENTNIKNWHMDGKLTYYQENAPQPMEIPVVVWYQIPDNIKLELSIQGMTSVALLKGDSIYANNPMAGQTKPEAITNPQQSQQMFSQISGFKEMTSGIIDGMKKGGFTFKYDSTLEMDGIKVLKVISAKKDSSSGQDIVANIYFDASTYYIHKVQNFIESQGQKYDETVLYKNAAKVNGIVIPKLNEIYVNGKLVQKIEFNTLEANVTIPNGTFDVN